MEVKILKNFLPLNRSIQKHWLWNEKPFSKGQAWIDLILLANYEDTKRVINGMVQCMDYKGIYQICKERLEEYERISTARYFLKTGMN